MVGFTEDELVHLVHATLPPSAAIPHMTRLLKVYYNGYLFSENARERI
jgi:hypothetical protein